MAWEKRGNGRQYFYLNQRQADGSVRKRYYGRGWLAEVESIRLEWKASLQRHELQERKSIFDLESTTHDCADSTRTLMEAHFFSVGLHNPKRRGWRRRREMIRPVEMNGPEFQVGEDLKIDAETERMTVGELVGRCRAGDKAAAKTLRHVLHEYPDLYHGIGQASLQVQAKWINAITRTDLFEREMMLRATGELRNALVEEGTGTKLEELVVVQVVSSQLQLAYHESREADAASHGAEVSKYRVNAIERASRRHAKALGALVMLRAVTLRLEQERGSQLATPVDDVPS